MFTQPALYSSSFRRTSISSDCILLTSFISEFQDRDEAVKCQKKSNISYIWCVSLKGQKMGSKQSGKILKQSTNLLNIQGWTFNNNPICQL